MIYTRTIMKLLLCVAAVTATKVWGINRAAKYDVPTPDGIRQLPEGVEQLIHSFLHPLERLQNARDFIIIKDCELHSFNGKYYQASYKELVADYDKVMAADFEMPKKDKEFLKNLKSKMEFERGVGATFHDVVYIAPPVENKDLEEENRDSYRLIINELERPGEHSSARYGRGGRAEGMITKLVTCDSIWDGCEGETMWKHIPAGFHQQAENWFCVWREYHSNYEKEMFVTVGVNGSGFCVTETQWMSCNDRKFKGYYARMKRGTCGKVVPSNLKFEPRRMTNDEYSEFLRGEFAAAQSNGSPVWSRKEDYEIIGKCPWPPLEYVPTKDAKREECDVDGIDRRRRLARAEAWFNDQ